MGRRRLPDFTTNHERWLISYADFITLLFAFFVVMYSTSAVNSGDYRVLSQSIVRALGLPGVSLENARPGETGTRAGVLGRPESAAEDPPRVPLRAAANEPIEAGSAESPEPPEQLSRMERALNASLGDRISEDGLVLTPDSDWLEIRIPASLLFPSGSRALLADAEPILVRLAALLREVPNDIVVEGHTDDRPIRNGLFPSNWELSTARAAAVVRLLEQEGIAGPRLSATGYAATRPIADNESEEGRAKNRRVVLLVRSLVGDGAGLLAAAYADG